MMVKKRSGLIVNITSLGGSNYAFNVPYGVGKAAIDRMSVGNISMNVLNI